MWVFSPSQGQAGRSSMNHAWPLYREFPVRQQTPHRRIGGPEVPACEIARSAERSAAGQFVSEGNPPCLCGSNSGCPGSA